MTAYESALLPVLIGFPLAFVCGIAWLAIRLLRREEAQFLDARGWKRHGNRWYKGGRVLSQSNAVRHERNHGGVQ